jgi:hypothetical protein
MSPTFDEIVNKANMIRKVKHGDKVFATDILSLKNVLLDLIALLREEKYDETLLNLAESELNAIPYLQYGDICSYLHRLHIANAEQYLQEAIEEKIELELVATRSLSYPHLWWDIAFSPDGRYIAATADTMYGYPNGIEILSVPNLNLVASIPANREEPPFIFRPFEAEFSPDGHYLYSVGEIYNTDEDWWWTAIDKWTFPNLEHVARAGNPEEDPYWDAMFLEVSPNGQYICIPWIDTWYPTPPFVGGACAILSASDLSEISRVDSQQWSWHSWAKFYSDTTHLVRIIGDPPIVELRTVPNLELVKDVWGSEYWWNLGIDITPDNKQAYVLSNDEEYKPYMQAFTLPDLTRTKLTDLSEIAEYAYGGLIDISSSGRYIAASFYNRNLVEVMRMPRLIRKARVEGGYWTEAWDVEFSRDGTYLATQGTYTIALLREKSGKKF